ncbi:putative integral membrane protein [Eutypa lata UCREL1]|uniref:Putative integral membrane protein n=1 Tax=Eutypa lata (strain UCR-EL1) TaxID=1287681 RepID=M7TDM3_EUTLA|nr:putative integral membrane protein [Eutypa lata UCREL1]
MADTGTITLATYEGVGIPLIVIASAFVGTRCFMNYHTAHHKLGVDDSFMQPVESLDLISVVIIILVQGTLWLSKAPIIFVYLRLFGIHKWLRYISWATLVVAALVYIAGLIFTLVKCPVDPNNATFPAYQDCAASNTLTGVISGFVSVVVDMIIFTLPIPIILRLKLEMSKKIALGLTFFSGILGIFASVIALYFKWQALSGDGTQLVVPIFCLAADNEM